MPRGPEQHAQHDPLLVASLAAGDLSGTDRDLATSLVDDCAECRALHDDLISIARATAALPSAARPRDFRLSPEQAARLRPSGWRGLIAAFASPRLALTRQLGVGLTTLGLAGLLFSALPSLPLGMSGGAAAPAGPEFMSSDTTSEGLPAAGGGSPAASPVPAVQDGNHASPGGGHITAPEPSEGTRASATDDVAQVYGGASADNKGADAGEAGGAVTRDLTEPGTGVPLLVVASSILLAAGIALLLARRLARRIAAG
jgi:hypothetical protein